MKFRTLLSEFLILESTFVAYHGTKEKFDSFDLDKIGNGLDQNGPGIYLTLDKSDA